MLSTMITTTRDDDDEVLMHQPERMIVLSLK